MKSAVAMVFLAALVATAAAADAQRHLAHLRVQRMTSKAGGNFTWWTDYGSYAREYNRCVGIEIEARNMGAAQDEFKIQWFFIAKDVKTGKLRVFDYGKQIVILGPGGIATAAVASKPLAAKDTTYVLAGRRYLSGDKLDGYIVLVKAGDQIIAQEASAPHLLQQVATLTSDSQLGKSQQ
jgi:hypothetical protein